jgi:hypothetical protein
MMQSLYALTPTAIYGLLTTDPLFMLQDCEIFGLICPHYHGITLVSRQQLETALPVFT